MKIPSMAELAAKGEVPEILFWVGCAGSFDARAQKVSKALVRILHAAGVQFAILGDEEQCTGDPARRAGNEFVFQMLALQNIETLNGYGIKHIVTTCPHCFNILKNEYPELGGSYEVVHHTQYMKKLLDDGRLTLPSANGHKEQVTYHDSCYMGRANGIYDIPRELLDALGYEIREMERNRQKGLCCGAGGAQMFKEEEAGKIRVNEARIAEALDTGTQRIAANCPFCLTMLGDGIKATDKQDEVMVYDISELIVERIAKQQQ